MNSDIMQIDENPYGPYGAQDDMTGFLHVYQGGTVNIAWAADNDGHGIAREQVWTEYSPRSVIGLKLLHSPNPDVQISYNWWVSNTAGDPKDWGPWKAENQPIWAAMNPYGSGNIFPDNVLGTPGGDVSKYFIMSNGEIDYDNIYSCEWPSMHPEEGWLPVNEAMCSDLANGYDTRFLFSFGPFDQIAPGDSLSFAVAFVIGETLHVDPLNLDKDPNMTNPDRFYANLDFTSLVQNALIAEKLYYDSLYTLVPGDVTGDAVIDIVDVIYLIKYLFSHGNSPLPLRAGDVNRDCWVNIEDVVYLINYLFINGPPPQVGCA